MAIRYLELAASKLTKACGAIVVLFDADDDCAATLGLQTLATYGDLRPIHGAGSRIHRCLVSIHPFANGNGRHARVATDRRGCGCHRVLGSACSTTSHDNGKWGAVSEMISSAKDHLCQD